MKKKIVVVGSSNTDLVAECRRLPVHGETVLGDRFFRFAGGKGANQAVAAARAGANVVFVGAHGDDSFGMQAKDALTHERIDTRYFSLCSGVPSGVALILLGKQKGQKMIAVAPGANHHLTTAHIRKAARAFRGARVAVLQLEIPLKVVEAAVDAAVRESVPVILNPSPAVRLDRKLLSKIHILIPNETEARLLTGMQNIEKSALQLRVMGCERVIVTLGAQGALIADEVGVRRISAPKVKAIDTVGAGDCFTGWVAAGVVEGLSMNETVRRAIRAASWSVTRRGAWGGMPFRKQIS
jgi:ribokinase